MMNYIYTALGSAVLVYITYSEITKYNLESDVKDLQSKLRDVNANYTTCYSSLTKQNKEINSYKLDIETKQKELAEWKVKPIKVRYETIYKEVVRNNNLTGECDEVKDIISNISSINLNSL